MKLPIIASLVITMLASGCVLTSTEKSDLKAAAYGAGTATINNINTQLQTTGKINAAQAGNAAIAGAIAAVPQLAPSPAPPTPATP